VEGSNGFGSVDGLCIALHVEGDAASDVRLATDAIDGFLHLAVAPVAAFHGIGCGRQWSITQKGQCLLEVGREELSQRGADCLESANAPA